MEAAGTSWDWHLVSSELREHGHDPVAVDLPSEDDSAGWWRRRHSRAGGRRSQRPRRCGALARRLHRIARLRAHARPAARSRGGDDPSPGELFADWWTHAGYEKSGYEDVFYHDVPPALAAEAKRRERGEDSKALREPWPLQAWPDVPTRYLLCRDDRMFPAAWARRHARERLNLEADEIDGGHYITLSRPRELAERLAAYAATIR